MADGSERPEPSAFQELRARVRAAARLPGRNELSLAGVSVVRADTPVCPKRGWVHSLSLGVIVQGQKRVRIAGSEYAYDPQHYLVVTGAAELEASVPQASARHPYLSLSVQVDPELVARVLIALAEASLSPGPSARSSAQSLPAYVSRLDAPMVDALVRLLRALDDDAERRILAPLVLQELVFRLLRSESAALLRQAAIGDDDEHRIAEAMAFMRERATERLTVERIARHIAMSPSHFAHRFTAIARVSPMRYLKHVRLQRARLLMIKDGARPAQAGAAVGYASPSHFTRDFKSYYELSPGEYVQRFRSGLAAGSAG